MSAPLHQRIRAEIEAKILAGTLAPGDRLPTEHELMAAHGCARMTVNKALSALVAAGLVERRKRAGSFVARPRLHAMVLDVPDLRQEVERRGQAYAFALLDRRIERGRAKEPGERDLGPGRILALAGLHFADGRELAVEQRRISLAAVPEAEAAAFEHEAPGAWLLRTVPWTEAETRIAAVAADLRSAARLHLAPGAPLLQIERRTWRGADRITWVRQCFRADAYDLFARFAAQDQHRRL